MIYITIKVVLNKHVLLLLICIAVLLAMVPAGNRANATNETNLALNSDGIGYPSVSASFTCCQNQDNPLYTIDGIFSMNRWTNYGGNATDWVAINFGSPTTFNQVKLYVYNDGGGVKPPASYNVQYLVGDTWVDATNQVKSPGAPTGALNSIATEENTLNTVNFDTVVSDQLRVVFTNSSGSYSGIVELEVFYVDPTPLGEGTFGSPYEISTAAHLQFMSNHLSASYVLTNHINLTGVSWTPIGATDSNSFTGSLDGQGYSITGLSINTASDYIGLFGAIGLAGVVENLAIDGAVMAGSNNVGVLAGSSKGSINKVIISNANVSATDYAGALVGKHESGTIQDSHTSGIVLGDHFVAGLAGGSSGSIIDSSAAVSVTGTGYYIAGLVGYLHSGATIADSYASGNVTGPSNTGGLVGQSANSTITNSYALGNVSSGGSLVGYNFNWTIVDSYASGLVGGSGQTLVGDGNGTVTGSYWKPYIVSFDSNGGSAVSIQGVESGGMATTPAAPTKVGHEFLSWYSDTGLNTLYSFNTNISAHTTIYAKWLIDEYTVTFVTYGDSPGSSQTGNYHFLLSDPGTPTKAGHVFAGWYSDLELTTAYSLSTPVVEDMILYGGWIPISYTVNFDSNGGSYVDNQSVNDNDSALIPPDPTMAGYSFVDWYIDSDLLMPYNFSELVTEDITLYAKWESYTEAEGLVAIAEMHQTQISVDMAYLAVAELTDGMKIYELQSRLITVQAMIDSTTLDISHIVRLMNEGAAEQKDINQDDIFDSLDVQIMLQRISRSYHDELVE